MRGCSRNPPLDVRTKTGGTGWIRTNCCPMDIAGYSRVRLQSRVHSTEKLERSAVIETAPEPWQGPTLPLRQPRSETFVPRWVYGRLSPICLMSQHKTWSTALESNQCLCLTRGVSYHWTSSAQKIKHGLVPRLACAFREREWGCFIRVLFHSHKARSKLEHRRGIEPRRSHYKCDIMTTRSSMLKTGAKTWNRTTT